MSPPRPPRVLILDDRRDSAAFLCSIFTTHAFEAASTSDVHRAMDSVLDEGVDVVVVAYLSDGGATAHAVTRVRSSPEAAVRDVAMVTLVDDPWSAEQAIAAGADAVLVRPVHASRLVAVVSRSAATKPASRAARRTAF
jgi:DNA-binding response OmpR family regulator